MASEDSDQLLAGLLAIHRLSDLCDLRQAHVGQADAAVDHLNTASELDEVRPLR